MTQPTDGDLLRRFRERSDQEAFAALMQRHGRMVMSAARAVLRETAGAEDVLQATFLALARKASSLAGDRPLASWLYRVAVCLARDARRREVRRRDREMEATMRSATHDDAPMLSEEGRAALFEEIGLLAERDRAPLVLHHMEGESYESAAAQLGCSPKTFSSRLTRARDKLRRRLTRRGVTLGALALATILGQQAAAAEVPAALVASTSQAAALIAAGKSVTSGLVSAKAATLTKGAMKMLFWSQAKILSAVCCCVLTVGLAVPVAFAAQRPEPAATPAEDKPAPAPREKEPPPKEALATTWLREVRKVGKETKLLLHMDGGRKDASASAHMVTARGQVFDNPDGRFGGAVTLDGRSCLSVADSEDFAFGDGYFTIDCWVRYDQLPTPGPVTHSQCIFSQRRGDKSYMRLTLNNEAKHLYLFQTSTGGEGLWMVPNIEPDRWYHLALVRRGTRLTLYQDGVSLGTSTIRVATADVPAPLLIGGSSMDSWRWLKGSIDDFRIAKGVSRWQQDFSVPAAESEGAAPSPTKGSDVF